MMTMMMAVISFLPLLSPPLHLMVILLSLYVVILFVFCIIHGLQTLGLKLITAFFIISAVLTYVMEWFGTHYGLPFGSYYYTHKIGPLLFGVPFVIPIQWFNMLYVCYIMARAVFTRFNWFGDRNKGHSKLVKSVLMSLIAGAFMVAWDLINDPFMVGLGAWVWTDPLWFFGLTYQGIPITNFIGWEFTSFLAVLLFEIYREKKHVDIHWPSGEFKSLNLLILFPYILAYFSQAVQGVMSGIFPLNDIAGLTPLIVSSIAMGVVIFISTISLTKIHEID